MNLKRLMGRVADSNAADNFESKVAALFPNKKIERKSTSVWVYTNNTFVDTKHLNSWCKSTGASMIEVSADYTDKSKGFIYIFVM